MLKYTSRVIIHTYAIILRDFSDYFFMGLTKFFEMIISTNFIEAIILRVSYLISRQSYVHFEVDIKIVADVLSEYNECLNLVKYLVIINYMSYVHFEIDIKTVADVFSEYDECLNLIKYLMITSFC